ncbi:MAG: hypothetical protein A2044_01485 [Candidatus Firestonebacteria bacterium GWA2_43_8]|nr:MAG: hypothetical protein A2044_01485 [Candidatus Firestonebacteria bacterium GWA2_43_8]
MKKLAVFVEGQTEQLFVCKLLEEIAGKNNITIEKKKWRINKKGIRVFTTVDVLSSNKKTSYNILIYDCGSDSKVKSDISENYDNLVKNNYDKIIGLRDVYPNKYQEIGKIEKYLHYGIKTKPISVSIVLAVMEIEAWFLAEASHFTKIHKKLTIDRIVKHLNFDITKEDIELRNHPAQDLNNIYGLESFAYNKRRKNCERTIKALDFNLIYLDLVNRIKYLSKFIYEINSFLT